MKGGEMTESKKVPELIPVADREALRRHGILYAPKTLRKMHCIGQHLELFIKIGSKLCIDLSEWQALVMAAKQQTKVRAERLKKLGLLEDNQAD